MTSHKPFQILVVCVCLLCITCNVMGLANNFVNREIYISNAGVTHPDANPFFKFLCYFKETRGVMLISDIYSKKCGIMAKLINNGIVLQFDSDAYLSTIESTQSDGTVLVSVGITPEYYFHSSGSTSYWRVERLNDAYTISPSFPLKVSHINQESYSSSSLVTRSLNADLIYTGYLKGISGGNFAVAWGALWNIYGYTSTLENEVIEGLKGAFPNIQIDIYPGNGTIYQTFDTDMVQNLVSTVLVDSCDGTVTDSHDVANALNFNVAKFSFKNFNRKPAFGVLWGKVGNQALAFNFHVDTKLGLKFLKDLVPLPFENIPTGFVPIKAMF